MKKTLKQFSYWILPPGIEAKARLVRNLLLPFEFRRRLLKNKIFHNKHQGQRCFILATGPSIAAQDLSALSSEICFSVSSFYLHPQIGIVKPAYHVECAMHAPFGREDIEKAFSSYKNNLPDSVSYFFGHTNYADSYYNVLGQIDPDMLEKSHFINYCGSAPLHENLVQFRSVWDIVKTPFAPRTVIYTAIQIAAYMGFSKIYLLGCDHDYLKRYFSNDYADHHFYPDAKDTQRGTVEYLEAFTLEEWFKEYYFRWHEYRLMRDFLAGRGQHIFNATNGGMLDVFPRVRLEDVLLEPSMQI